jgi:hypothetical protein
MPLSQETVEKFFRLPVDYREPIKWAPMSTEILTECVSTARFDLDFIAFCTTGANMFSCSAVSTLIQSPFCRFFSACFVQNVRANYVSKVLSFGCIGEFVIGLPLFGQVAGETDDEDEDENESTLVSTHYSTTNNLKIQTNSILAKYKNIPQYTLGLFIEKLLEHFAPEKLVLFRYGQKQSLNVVHNILIDLSSRGQLSVAIGCEVDFKDKFVAYNMESGHKKVCSYPVLLSNVAGNTIIKGQTVLFDGSYHLAIYNTLHHFRKHIEHYVTWNDSHDEFDNSKLESMIRKNITDLEVEVSKIICESKLRIEAYVELNRGINLIDIQIRLKKVLGFHNLFVFAPKASLEKLISSWASFSRPVCSHMISLNTFTGLFSAIMLMAKYISGMFSYQRYTAAYRAENVGLRLNKSKYLLPQIEFTDEVVFDNRKLDLSITKLFVKISTKNFCLQFYLKIFQLEMIFEKSSSGGEHNENIISAQLTAFCNNFIVSALSQYKVVGKEPQNVSFSSFIEYLIHHRRSKGILSLCFERLLKWKVNFASSFDKLSLIVSNNTKCIYQFGERVLLICEANSIWTLTSLLCEISTLTISQIEETLLLRRPSQLLIFLSDVQKIIKNKFPDVEINDLHAIGMILLTKVRFCEACSPVSVLQMFLNEECLCNFFAYCIYIIYKNVPQISKYAENFKTKIRKGIRTACPLCNALIPKVTINPILKETGVFQFKGNGTSSRAHLLKVLAVSERRERNDTIPVESLREIDSLFDDDFFNNQSQSQTNLNSSSVAVDEFIANHSSVDVLDTFVGKFGVNQSNAETFDAFLDRLSENQTDIRLFENQTDTRLFENQTDTRLSENQTDVGLSNVFVDYSAINQVDSSSSNFLFNNFAETANGLANPVAINEDKDLNENGSDEQILGNVNANNSLKCQLEALSEDVQSIRKFLRLSKTPSSSFNQGEYTFAHPSEQENYEEKSENLQLKCEELTQECSKLKQELSELKRLLSHKQK